MRVTFVTSEVRPFSQTGGLADVSAALPAALAALGCDMTVISPLYRSTAAALAAAGVPLEELAAPPVRIAGIDQPVRARVTRRDGCRLAFVAHDAFYDRPGLYGAPGGDDYPDHVARFGHLCAAALRLAGTQSWADIFHCNDWQTALLPVYLRAAGPPGAAPAAPSVFTVHNLAYQGHATAADLRTAGLDASWFHPGALEYWGGVNLMKGGLIFADALTTVSPSYAEEIQTPAAGCGLDGVLRAQREKLRGILNGIDVASWNPADDAHIAAPFSARDLTGKAHCKRALQERSGLPIAPGTFLLAAIGRFDRQKGLPLVCDAFRLLAPLGPQLVILGSGDAGIEAQARALAAAFPAQVSLTVGFDEALAHQIEAGADAFLMPSAYEPCGLNQMYSQRYGTVPIVHATGGLQDTVVDATAEHLAAGTASGFRFDVFDSAHLAEATLRAWRLYDGAPDAWRGLAAACMRLDHSWTRSARAYLDLYRELRRPAAVAPESIGA